MCSSASLSSIIEQLNKTMDLGLQQGWWKVLSPAEEVESGRHFLHLSFVGKRDKSISTTKTCLLQDPSSPPNKGDISLNSCQAKAPDMENSILGLLMKSQTTPFIALGDIEKFYFKLLVHPSQRKYMGFYARFDEKT